MNKKVRFSATGPQGGVMYLVGGQPGQTQYLVPAGFVEALGLDEIEHMFDTLLPRLPPAAMPDEDRPA